MPRGMYRSRKFRKVFIKVPGGRTQRHYRRRKPGKAICGQCRNPLPGVARELPVRMRNMPKTKKRPERPYGGVLCSKCTRALLREKAREEVREGQ